MKYDFNQMLDRESTISSKWSKEARISWFGKEDIIPMGIADMDLASAPAVVDAIKKRAEHPTYGYGYPSKEFNESVAAWQKKRNGWDVKPEWNVYTPGVNMAIMSAIEMTCEPGDRVIVQDPVYYPYHDFVKSAGCSFAHNSLVNNDGYYEINFEQLEEQAKDPRTKAIIFCSPQNPTGRCWTKEEIERLGRICIDNNVLVIADEIHSDLVLPPNKHVVFAKISEEFANNSIICTSPSKTFNLAGLLISDIIIPNDELRAKFVKKLSPYYLWPGTFGTVAQLAAYKDGDEWLDALLEHLKSNSEYIEEFLAENLPKIKYKKPEATYLAWLDFKEYGYTTDELDNKLLNEACLALDFGAKFGLNGEGDGFARMNFAVPRPLLEEALERLKKAFA